MLTQFSVKNFRGFAQTLTWDLKNTKSYEFNPQALKNGIVKNGLIYGPNGCGKSNLGIALFDIVYHLTDKWKDPGQRLNFLCLSTDKSFAEFSYTFEFGTEKIVYEYEKNETGLFHTEKLLCNNERILEKTETEFFLHPMFPVDQTIQKRFTDTPVYNVSIVKFLLTSIPLPPEHFLNKLSNFANSMLWFRSLDSRSFIGLETLAGQNIEEYIIRNELVNDYSQFLERLSGQKFHFLVPKKGDQNLLCNFGHKNAPFSLIASTGTRTLELLYFWFKHLDSASFVFIDEFDAFYHFELAENICRELFNKPYQAFLSTHNTYLMSNELLRPDCLFLLNNNKIKPLCDCTEKELRMGHNLEKMFRAGSFNE
ncbi:MAG: AAA family ATPase [Fibrobacteraceae bacterium]